MYMQRWKHSGHTEPSSNYRKCVRWETYLLTNATGGRLITMRAGYILRVSWPVPYLSRVIIREVCIRIIKLDWMSLPYGLTDLRYSYMYYSWDAIGRSSLGAVCHNWWLYWVTGGPFASAITRVSVTENLLARMISQRIIRQHFSPPRQTEFFRQTGTISMFSCWVHVCTCAAIVTC